MLRIMLYEREVKSLSTQGRLYFIAQRITADPTDHSRINAELAQTKAAICRGSSEQFARGEKVPEQFA
jgi:hypothetical protein